MNHEKRIHLLDPLVAQRIAAGEVIDRPASVVRELIDNSLDAGSSSISVHLEEGGIALIKVIDDGFGIHPDDLKLIARSHATSKVKSLSDFDSLSTLGFRGEALYSIAAGAQLTISTTQAGSIGASVTVHGGHSSDIMPGGPTKGTVIEVKDLFAEIPARRLFLKRPSSESRMVKTAIIEKALAFPQVRFSMSHNGKETLFLAPSSLAERVHNVLKDHKDIVPSEMIEMSDTGEHFSLHIIATTEQTYRTDRKYINVFVNNRIVDEFSFVQAVTYGYDPYLPGGAYPYCYLYITVDPDLVDFNIHPAKREVKIRNRAEIHHQIVALIQQNLQLHHYKTSRRDEIRTAPRSQNLFTHDFSSSTYRGERFQNLNPDSDRDPAWFDKAKKVFTSEYQGQKEEKEVANFRYIGQIFSLFLLVEKDDSLFLVDQHAAHERILYDEMKAYDGFQPLIIPAEFEVDRSVQEFLLSHTEMYRELGIDLRQEGELSWALHAVTPHYKDVESDLIGAIQSFTSGTQEELHKLLFATAACRKAIKEGDSIDYSSAVALLRKVFALDYPVCPHGRNFVVEITRESLYSSVGRIL